MTEIESSLVAEVEHLVEIVNQIREEVKLLQRDIYILQSNKTPVTHIGTFVK